jgi:hypothetical protein
MGKNESGKKGKLNMPGVDCDICKQRIRIDEKMIMFSPTRKDDNKYMHACCYQEILLCEIWGALFLDIKYRSHCEHVDMTTSFDPLRRK